METGNDSKMTALLKMVARDSLYRTVVDSSDRTKMLNGKLEEEFEHLQDILGEDPDEPLLEKLDAALNQWVEAEAADHYIKGFIQGVAFILKNQEKNNEKSLLLASRL